MIHYNIPDLQSHGFTVIAVMLRTVLPGMWQERLHAQAMDVELQSLRYFRVAPECWAICLEPDFKTGYKETAILPF